MMRSVCSSRARVMPEPSVVRFRRERYRLGGEVEEDDKFQGVRRVSQVVCVALLFEVHLLRMGEAEIDRQPGDQKALAEHAQ